MSRLVGLDMPAPRNGSLAPGLQRHGPEQSDRSITFFETLIA